MEKLENNKIEENACLKKLKINFLNGLIDEELTKVFYLELKNQIGLNILTNKPILESILKKYNINFKVKGDLISEDISYKFQYKNFDIRITLSKKDNKIIIYVPYSKFIEIKKYNKLNKGNTSLKDRVVGLYFHEIITEEDFLQKMNLTLKNFNETFE